MLSYWSVVRASVCVCCFFIWLDRIFCWLLHLDNENVQRSQIWKQHDEYNALCKLTTQEHVLNATCTFVKLYFHVYLIILLKFLVNSKNKFVSKMPFWANVKLCAQSVCEYLHACTHTYIQPLGTDQNSVWWPTRKNYLRSQGWVIYNLYHL